MEHKNKKEQNINKTGVLQNIIYTGACSLASVIIRLQDYNFSAVI